MKTIVPISTKAVVGTIGQAMAASLVVFAVQKFIEAKTLAETQDPKAAFSKKLAMAGLMGGIVGLGLWFWSTRMEES
jgi:hypothetical protein